jgi:hypothetical protein
MTVDYGVLAHLIGTFRGDKGIDIAPDMDGSEENLFEETLTFLEAGYVTNAEEQKLAVLHYHQIVKRKSDNAVIHNQTGYWMWDKQNDEIIQSIAIPRAVCLLAKGKAIVDNDKIIIEVKSDIDDKSYGIIQSPFMHQKAKTTSFVHTMTIQGDNLSYKETTMVDIYGKNFEHTDENELIRYID